jgi:hypothetical protein
MKPDDDQALRAALEEAHRGDPARTPSFERAWGAARRGGRRRASPVPWLVTCGTLLTAAGLAVWLVGRLGPAPAQLPTGTSWRGPTDFLLETPGLVTLRTVPDLVPTLPDPVLRPDPGSRRGNP